MTSLDVEIILSSATERVALNITNWWHEELIGVGFRAQIISSSFNHNGFDATMMRLEVEITPSFSVQITLNPRSGFASVSMAHLIQVPDVDLDMILSLGISRAQALLNGDHTKIVAALCKISLAVCFYRDNLFYLHLDVFTIDPLLGSTSWFQDDTGPFPF